jgi:O-antigen ligase
MPLDWLVTQIMGLGVVLALVGIVQMLVWGDRGEELIYFFWEPVYAGGATPFGPFINRNHFAGWMVMALPLVLGYAWAILDAARRPSGHGLGAWIRWFGDPQVGRFGLAAFAAVTMGAAVILTSSRSGAGSLLVALGVLGIFLLQRFGGRWWRMAAVAAVAALLVGSAAWVGLDVIVERFQQAPVEIQDRVAVWRDTVRIFADFPLFGTGLGAYGMVMLFYQTAPQHTAFVQAHNDYLQVLAEGGLLVAIPSAAVIALVVVGIRRRFVAGDDVPMAHWIRAGAFAGLVGIAVQALVEFSLQKPGNTILFILLLAIALHRPRRTIEDAHSV